MFDDDLVLPVGTRSPPMSIQTGLSPLAAATKDMIETLCRIPGGAKVGQPFRFEAFQLPLLEAMADPDVTTIVFSIGRKNGKTATVGVLIPALMIGPMMLPNSHIVCGAMSRRQAGFLYTAASQTILLSPALTKKFVLRPSQKEIYCPSTGVTFTSLSADATTAYGESPRIVIMDELGQVRGPTYPLYDALTTAQGAYDDGKVIIISTRPPEDGDLMNLIIDSAETDPSVRCILYETPEDADIFDERVWYLANPALGKFRSLDDVRRMARKAKHLPSFESIFRNYVLNQKVDPTDTVISVSAWKKCLRSPREFPRIEEFAGYPVYLAADLSAKKDMTAVAMVWPTEEIDESTGDLVTRMYLKVLHYMPGEGLKERAEQDKMPYVTWAEQGWINTGSGRIVDYEFVARDIAEQIYSTCSIEAVGFDRWRWEELAKELTVQDVDLPDETYIPIGQGFQDMNPCIEALENAVIAGQLVIEDNPVLNSCLSNALAEMNHLGERRWNKRKSVRRIDGIVAASMAVKVAADRLLLNSAVPAQKPSIYESQGFTRL